MMLRIRNTALDHFYASLFFDIQFRGGICPKAVLRALSVYSGLHKNASWSLSNHVDGKFPYLGILIPTWLGIVVPTSNKPVPMYCSNQQCPC